MVFYRAHTTTAGGIPTARHIIYYNLHNTASPIAEQVCNAAVSSRLSCVAVLLFAARLAHARARKNPINSGSAACVDVGGGGGGDKNICIHHHHGRRQ